MMISVEEAFNLVSEYKPKLGSIEISLNDLNDFSLSEDIFSDRPYPPINRSMMDGIAISFNNFQSGLREFLVKGVIAAGMPGKPFYEYGGCLEVMTGAMVPEGLDLVIPYEHLEIEKGMARIINLKERVQWENIHLLGSDCSKGERVLGIGNRIQGPQWGILASMGYAKARVEKKPRVLIVSTGDELVEVDQKAEDYQLRRSNVYALKASLKAHGIHDIEISHVSDNPQILAKEYLKNTLIYDWIIYSGGVSKGKFDYLPNVLTEMGVTRYFHTISQKPGKPMWFGVDHTKQIMVVGLPGNPVSSLVSLHRYLLPKKKIYVRLTETPKASRDLTLFIPAKIESRPDGCLWASPLKMKNSGEFLSLAESDGFIEIPKSNENNMNRDSALFFSWGPR